MQTEATIKIWVDGERYVRTAEGNGPVQRARHARCARRSRETLSAPARHQARQLQGPHPRRVEGDRRGHARAARRLRRHRHVGRDRRPRERDRGELGRAGRLARGRHAAGREATGAASAEPRRDVTTDVDPARAPGPRRGGGGRRCIEVLRSRPALARPARARLRGRRSRRASARRHASAVSSGTAGAAPRAARGRRRGRRRGRHLAVLVRGLARTRSLYERARPVFADIDPVHAQPRPGRRGGGDHRRARRALLPVHIFGYPADMPGVRAPRAADRRGRLRGARRRPRRRRRRSAAAAIPPRSASTPTSSSPPARAGCSRWARPSTRSASTPSATRAARPTWAGSTTTGSASTTA